MSDVFIYIFVILLIAVIGIMIYTLSQIKKIRKMTARRRLISSSVRYSCS